MHLNAWFNNCIFAFFAYIANSMIALRKLITVCLRQNVFTAFQLIANPIRKNRISHLIDTCNQNQFYGSVSLTLSVPMYDN